jgi:subtilase family serine protease
MRRLHQGSDSPSASLPDAPPGIARRLLPALPVLLAALVFAGIGLHAQTANLITQEVDASKVRALPNHLPPWANARNHVGLASADLTMEPMTMVLARSPQQEQAFESLLAEQDNPASPNYHHWLTPEEIGERFGLSEQDMSAVTGWLESQRLHVNWVSPSRIFIGFGGTAGDTGRAFHTEVHYYKVDGVQRISVSSDPMVPEALAPAIRAIRGLYTIDERPLHQAIAMQLDSPDLTSGIDHYVVPADFATIYDLPASLTGDGETIGIAGRARTDFADYTNFRTLTGSTFSNPQEIVPTAFGGADPGPALTAPPGAGVSIAEQSEATLDVMRAGSVAPNATIKLVIATAASGGIDADAQYLVQSSPLPAQVMSISFGACESVAGAAGVDFWDALFQQAKGEGISVFVASGDAGASGCDTHNAAPPANPAPNSPNYICSSSYATCVGGTEFNDTSNPSTYWSSTNGVGYSSALSYIPEGAWNEPLNANGVTQASSAGGGVSTVIATPIWQTGTGVPVARTGRYTPDISFSSAGHDGYLGCMAAGGGSCAPGADVEIFSGTSAAAPDMAAIAALLDQKMGSAQGNLNPQLYAMAASVPAAFHDVTVASSGVSNCSVDTPSICNNSIPGRTGLAGGQAGFLVTTGYDEATGLGSLDVQTFIDNYAAAQGPAATTGAASAITANSATVAGSVIPNGADTQVWFLYGTNSALTGATQTTSQDIGSGTTATAVSANLGSLSARTQYYYQVVARNATGTTSGAINSFATIGAQAAAFTISGTAVTVTAGAATGNTSTITVTATGGFTGSVALTATVTSSPAGAVDPPTLSFGSTSPVSITGANAGTATLTIFTTAPQSSQCTSDNRMQHGVPWYTGGGAVLACVLLFGIPARLRKWRRMLGMLALLAAFAGGVIACGGSSGSTTCPGPISSATTAGQYTVSVTGTSGATTETGTVTLTVQ